MQWYVQKDEPNDAAETWPAFEELLRKQLSAALKKPAIAKPFLIVAATGVPFAQKLSVPTTLASGLAWNTAPTIWVDQTKHSAFFNKAHGIIVVNRRIVRTFEQSPKNQSYRDALEMLMLHELLHWLIHTLGGLTEHKPRGEAGDAVYGFEDAAYPDAAARALTLERMNV